MEITNVEKFSEKFEKEFQKYLSASEQSMFWTQVKGVSNSSAYTVNIPQYLTEIEANSSNSAISPDVVEWRENNKTVTQTTFKTKTYQVSSINEFFTENNMREDCMVAIKDFMNVKIGDFAAYKMATTQAGNIILTSGTGRTTGVIGSTATVKSITKQDFLNVKMKMAQSGVSGKWKCLITPTALNDLFLIDDFVKADALGTAQSRLLNGEFASILGIDFYVRHAKYGASVAYTNVTGSTTATKADIYNIESSGNTIGNDHVEATLFWNDGSLYKNQGLVDINISTKDAYHHADAISALYTFGLEPIRTDLAGIITLVEKHI